MARYLVSLLVVLIPAAQSLQGEESDDKTVANNVSAAWGDRTEKVKSFKCSFSHTETETVAINGPPDPLGLRNMGETASVILQTEMTFIMKGRKVRWESRGEEWDSGSHKLRNKSFSATFDGKLRKLLIIYEESSYPGAMIDNDKKADELLKHNTTLIPLWLSFASDRSLTRGNYDVTRMSAINRRPLDVRKEHVELSIPRRPYDCQVFVDNSKGYLPVRMVEWRGKNKKQSEYQIEYKPNKVLGWAIASWKSSLFDDDNQVEMALTGKVKDLEINGDISDSEFDLAFPPHTRIRETLDGKTRFYIQDTDGKRIETIPDAT